MRVIFLDMDGVLNSTRSALALKGYGFLHLGDITPGKAKAAARLDPIAVALLKRIVKETDAKIVISSSWRFRSVEQTLIVFNALLAAYGMKDVVVGSTPHHDFGIRGLEIEEWLSHHPEVTDYVILDDDDDMTAGQFPHFFQTDSNVGLGFSQCESIIDRWVKEKVQTY